MSFNLSDIKGLGKKEDTLKEAGIDTVEKLANAEVDDLTTLKGIGKATAEKFIENAKSIMSETAKGDSTEATEQESIEKKETKITREKSS